MFMAVLLRRMTIASYRLFNSRLTLNKASLVETASCVCVVCEDLNVDTWTRQLVEWSTREFVDVVVEDPLTVMVILPLLRYHSMAISTYNSGRM